MARYGVEDVDRLIREAIVSILIKRNDVLQIATRQKAKFEGWLKFELASYLEQYGMEFVEVESMAGYGRERSDISFSYNGIPYSVELKTPNANWKVDGVKDIGRPVTKNINSIIDDTMKLNSEFGIIAFVLFPIPSGDNRWELYLSRIKEKTSIELSREKNCEIVHSDYGNGINCDLVVCTYMSKYYRFR